MALYIISKIFCCFLFLETVQIGDVVVRGPDWKWGDQVNDILWLFRTIYIVDKFYILAL